MGHRERRDEHEAWLAGYWGYEVSVLVNGTRYEELHQWLSQRFGSHRNERVVATRWLIFMHGKPTNKRWCPNAAGATVAIRFKHDADAVLFKLVWASTIHATSRTLFMTV